MGYKLSIHLISCLKEDDRMSGKDITLVKPFALKYYAPFDTKTRRWYVID